MIGWLATPWAFFVRDFQLAVSYRAGFVLGLGGAVVNVLLFFFLSRFFGPLAGSLDEYGGSYFGFVIIGIAFSSFMAIGLSGLATKIREAQMMGTLELMVVSPTRLPVSLLASSLWSHAFALLTVGAYFVAGGLLKNAVIPKTGAEQVTGDAKICKVSIVGIGMRSHVGVASKMFSALSDEGINIQMITTSEIKTSVVIDEKYMELAVRALHRTFDLDQPAA